MARKKRKRAKAVKLAGVRVPKSLIRNLISAANTPVGRIIIAEALVIVASALMRKEPVAAATAAGAEAAGAAKDLAGAAGEAAISLLHAAADRLRASAGIPESRASRRREEASGQDDAATPQDGNGSGNLRDDLDPDTIRQAVLGEIGRKKGKKTKSAKRH